MTSPLVGLVGNARNCWPTAAQHADLRPSVWRSIVYDNDSYDRAISALPSSVKHIALINGEHEAVGNSTDPVVYQRAVQTFAHRFQGRVWGVELWNEWDLLGIDATTIGQLVSAASPALKAANMLRILGSVAGPNWQQALINARNFVRAEDFDWGAFHPYGQRIAAMGSPQPGFDPGMRASIERASALLGKPVAVTEFGAKIADYGGVERQAEYVTEAYREIRQLDSMQCPAACYFAWADGVGSPDEQGENAFGLIAADGTYRPAVAAYQALTTPPVEDRCETYRVRLLNLEAYILTHPKKDMSRPEMLRILRGAA